MKRILLLFLSVALFYQSGCATSPSVEEQSKQQQQEDQATKRSDAFARGLPQ